MESAICKIGVVTDSHVGIRHDGGWNQPVWIGGEDRLFDRLGQWRADNKVDFLIHCGDVAEPGHLSKGLRLLSDLGCPVAAVRGNHDIFGPVFYSDWKDELAEHPNLKFGDSVFENKLCDVVLLNNQWFDAKGTPQWHWETSPVGWLNPSQLQWLDRVLGARTDKPVIVVMHYPVDMIPPYPIPAEFRDYNLEYSRKLNQIFDDHERVKLVTSGHFHCSTARQISNRLHVTTAAFSEAPFQVRLLEITHSKMHVRTEQLYRPGDPVHPLAAKSHLNGSNREIEIALT